MVQNVKRPRQTNAASKHTKALITTHGKLLTNSERLENDIAVRIVALSMQDKYMNSFVVIVKGR